MRVDVVHVVVELLDVEALAVGLAAAAQVERVDGEAAARRTVGGPEVVPAVGVEPGKIATTRAAPAGRHDRTKMFSPPFPSIFST